MVNYLNLLEKAVKKLWRKHKNPQTIKALHAEVTVEPQTFVRGKLNPQVAEFLMELYLQKCKTNPLHNAQVEVKDGILRIINKNGKTIAETTSPKIIQNYLN